MKVSQLIEILQKMPPDVDIVTHANNHTTNHDDGMMVGLARLTNYKEPPAVVIVGNWQGWNIGHWHGSVTIDGPTYRVASKRYDRNDGEIHEVRLRHVPAGRRATYEPTPERWEFDDV